MEWVKSRIVAYLYSEYPVTAILQVQVDDTKLRGPIMDYIASKLNQPIEVAGATMRIAFEQDGTGWFVTRSGYVDNLKSTYLERRFNKIVPELKQLFPQWDGKLSIMFTKPLNYISNKMAKLAVDDVELTLVHE